MKATSHTANQRDRMRPFPELASVAAGQFGQLLGALLFIRIATEHLNPAEFGLFVLILTAVSFIQSGILGGIGGAITRYYTVASTQNEKGAYVSAITRLASAAMLISVAIGAISYAGVGIYACRETAQASLVTALIIGASVVSDWITALHAGARRQGVVAIESAGRQWLRAGALYGATAAGSTGYNAALLAVMVAAIATAALQISVLCRKEGGLWWGWDTSDWMKKLLDFAKPYTYWGVTSWGQQVADRWMLVSICGPSEVGLYVAIFQVAYSPLQQVSSAVHRYVIPVLYGQVGEAQDAVLVTKSADAIRKVSLAFMGGGLAISTLAAVLHTEIAALTLGAEYRHASFLIPLCTFAAGLNAAYHVAGSIVPALFRAEEMVKPIIVLSILAIGGFALGAYLQCALGVAVSLVVVAACHLVMAHVMSRRIVLRHIASIRTGVSS